MQNPKQASCSELSAQSPMQGWNSRTARSRPEPKWDAQATNCIWSTEHSRTFGESRGQGASTVTGNWRSNAVACGSRRSSCVGRVRTASVGHVLAVPHLLPSPLSSLPFSTLTVAQEPSLDRLAEALCLLTLRWGGEGGWHLPQAEG